MIITIDDIDELTADLRGLMRRRDAALTAQHSDPEAELDVTWREARIRKMIKADGVPVCVNLSRHYVEMGQDCALWSLITFAFADDHPLVFARRTRDIIRHLFAAEPHCISKAFSVIPCEFTESIEWHRRVIRSREVFRFTYMGQLNALVEMRRDLWL